MSLRGAPAIACLAALLSGCESTQDRSARLKSHAVSAAVEQGLQIKRVNPDVRVTTSVVLTDPRSRRSAAVITLRNTSSRPQVGLPVLFALKDGAGKQVFTNGSPGAGTDLVTVPSLPARGTLTWIDDAIVDVRGARHVDARVGIAPGAPAATNARLPVMRVFGVSLERDPVGGLTATGRVVNESSVPQTRLVIYAVARRKGAVVAAGRAVVPLLKPHTKRPARFTVFFVGDPSRGTLSVQAPPVSAGHDQ